MNVLQSTIHTSPMIPMSNSDNAITTDHPKSGSMPPDVALIQPSFEKTSLDSEEFTTDASAFYLKGGISTRKHRRMDSNSLPLAHRRTDSAGNHQKVSKHTRQGSGLDFLAAIANDQRKDNVEKEFDPPLQEPTRREPPPSFVPEMHPPPQRRVSYYVDPRMMQQQQQPQPYRMVYPPPYAMTEYSMEPSRHNEASQTYATALEDKSFKNVSTNTEQRAHHRKLSSLNSLGPIMEPSAFPPTPGSYRNKAHHRATSSISLFSDLVGFEGETAFLPSMGRTMSPELVQSKDRSIEKDSKPAAVKEEGSSKLPEGGSSKRVRRKCHVEGCENRVVQGGRCISHGAKRKSCKHPGCTKNVKKAGLCSAHGPARKRCEAGGCQKVAVQGGRCIAHGAKKKACCIGDCQKQAILNGMCKKHHDASNQEEEYCQPVHKPTHTRGLSIFNEIKADELKDILRDGM